MTWSTACAGLSAPSGGTPTSVAHFAYDGEGRRVSQSLTTGGTTVKTRYVLGLEEQTGDVSSNPVTKYETVAGVCAVVIVGTGPTESISYLASDGLGSVSEALDGNGNVTAQQLYGPYGGVRYQSGTMPTAKGFTGQYADATTGLDYYGARYYDPLVGQFISPDSAAAGGLNRYAYVGGNPETATDPTGHHFICQTGNCSGGSGGSSGGGSGGSSGGLGGCGTCTRVPGNRVGDTTAGPCTTQPAMCHEIDSIFHDSKLQQVLQQLLDSQIGQELLGFLLKVGAAVGGAYITWANLGSCETSCVGGYTNALGFIQLNSYYEDDPTDAAALLVHEATESYYAIEDGIRTFASQQMDYLAQWFKGEFEVQSNNASLTPPFTPTNDGNYEAYGLTFEQWTKTSDFKAYSGQAPFQLEVQAGTGILPGFAGTTWIGAARISALDQMASQLQAGPTLPQILNSVMRDGTLVF